MKIQQDQERLYNSLLPYADTRAVVLRGKTRNEGSVCRVGSLTFTCVVIITRRLEDSVKVTLQWCGKSFHFFACTDQMPSWRQLSKVLWQEVQALAPRSASVQLRILVISKLHPNKIVGVRNKMLMALEGTRIAYGHAGAVAIRYDRSRQTASHSAAFRFAVENCTYVVLRWPMSGVQYSGFLQRMLDGEVESSVFAML